MSIDWTKVMFFKEEEFDCDLSLLNPEILYTVDGMRKRLGAGISPSKAEGAIVRFGGSETSQHYVGEVGGKIVRRSSAMDLFPNCKPIEFLVLSLCTPGINGIGVYFDTKNNMGVKQVMFHVDIRQIGYNDIVPLIWIVKKESGKDKYFYPQVEKEYWSLLKDDILHRSWKG
jgi:hypothetical protein